MKRKVNLAALEWDDSVFQEQLKSLIYVNSSLHGYPKKDKLIDEFNLKNFVGLKRNTTSKFFVDIIIKKLIFHPEFFDANNIFSHTFIQNVKY